MKCKKDKWRDVYLPMRNEMLGKYRPDSRLYRRGNVMGWLDD